MAKTCGTCGTAHEPGDCPLGGGGRKKKDKRDDKKVPKHDHKWRWKRRSQPIMGRPYDEYYCTFPGCTETQQRPV